MATDKNTGNGMDEERINAQFSEHQRRAEETLGDKAKTKSVLDHVWEKLQTCASASINLIWEDICLLMDVIKAYITGRYRKIPFKTMAMILGALTYFSWPFDFIFDLLPVIGFMDDVFVIGMVIKFAHDDLQEYKKWEAAQSETKADAKTTERADIVPPAIVSGFGL